jgi:hypothetical protein
MFFPYYSLLNQAYVSNIFVFTLLLLLLLLLLYYYYYYHYYYYYYNNYYYCTTTTTTTVLWANTCTMDGRPCSMDPVCPMWRVRKPHTLCAPVR